MSLQFLQRLKDAHRRISRQIEIESSRLQPDDMRLSKLKKTRLSLKDRMARVSAYKPA